MRNDKTLTAIGLMSGTSLEGIDAAIIETDGERIKSIGPSLSVPYDHVTRASILRAEKAAREGRDEAKDVYEASNLVESAHVDAVRSLMEKNGLRTHDVDVIGFHGQTLLHRPPLDATAPGRTWQIGEGRVLAQELKIDVVDQFRSRDMAAGGRGGPLGASYHAALASYGRAAADGFGEAAAASDWTAAQPLGAPIALLTIGSLAQVAYVPTSCEPSSVMASDCGPGQVLLKQWIERHPNVSIYDSDALAASGTVDEQAVAMMALNPIVKKAPPKSLDRFEFKLGGIENLSVDDGVATLTAFIAECVARTVPQLPSPPGEWIVCGHARHNTALMDELTKRVDAAILSAEERGWNGDMMKAECMGFLAVRSLKEMPLSYPSTTGVRRAISGGTRHRGAVRL